jgi:uncharacterized protein
MRAGKPLGRRRRGDDRSKLLPARRAAKLHRRRRHRARSSAAEVLALRRSLGKAHPRVVAVDDGAFARTDRSAPIAAVVMSAPDYVESIRTDRVRVDGRDATRRVVAVVRATGPLDGVRAVLLDGAVLGGFNVVDLDLVHRQLGRPVVAVTRRPPEFARIRAALRKWFPRDAGRRWKLLTAHRLFPIPTGGQPILAAAVGCTRADAAHLVRRTTRRGYWPEPLRLAHLVASAGGRPGIGRRARANN